jgi:hypothetical protein
VVCFSTAYFNKLWSQLRNRIGKSWGNNKLQYIFGYS